MLRDVYAVFLSGTVSKLCGRVISVTSLPPLGGVCLGATRAWHSLTSQTLSIAFFS